MARRACLLALLSTSAICAGELTPAQKQLNIDSFEHVWEKVRDTHWDPKLGGVDWQAVHDELRPAIEKAETMVEARKAMRDMLGRLHQTHFGIIPADAYQEVGEKSTSSAGEGETGIEVRVIDGHALVTAVRKDSPAAKAGVRAGWRIARIEGKAVDGTIESVGRAYKDSTLLDMMLSRAIAARLSGGIGSRIRVEFLDGSGTLAQREIGADPPRGEMARFGLLPPQHVWVESRKIDGSIGYLAFNMFLDPARLMPAFEDAITNCRDCAGMIIDLRGNPGGIGIMAMGLAGWFIEEQGRRLGTMLTRSTPLNFVVNPRLPLFRGPVAILVDGLSASTSEIFAGGMQDLKRARIFGSRTAGAALPSFIERLPNGDGFQCATANYLSQSGKPLEGAGVIPDVMAPPTRALLLAGKDAALEAAIHWIHYP
ncbi:MAG TPA: S41 family peptidase [Bryobacteraceae bacterium]|nr:S41 family peptidase [Bryobacteraceae bacterium]